jgi:hypothetical protein
MVQKKDGSIGIVANWDVYGSVHHQKHVHYRCNTYTAQVIIKPAKKNYWKLVKIQLFTAEPQSAQRIFILSLPLRGPVYVR